MMNNDTLFQNRKVCGQVFPLLPSPFHFSCSPSKCRAITRLETLVQQGTGSQPKFPANIAPVIKHVKKFQKVLSGIPVFMVARVAQ